MVKLWPWEEEKKNSLLCLTVVAVRYNTLTHQLTGVLHTNTTSIIDNLQPTMTRTLDLEVLVTLMSSPAKKTSYYCSQFYFPPSI